MRPDGTNVSVGSVNTRLSPRRGTLVALVIGVMFMQILMARVQGAVNFNTVYLSEFMGDDPRGTVQDEDGDRCGWIELYNGGRGTVNLGGWALTDATNNLVKWRFPGVALLPNHYLVVFASGKGRANVAGPLHTNFRLSPQGSYLALANAAGNVVSEFAPVRRAAGHSYGRLRDEPTTCGAFARPTPGKPNASSGPGFAPEVAFSWPSGTFVAPFLLQLASGSTNAVIRYTLDGTLPSRSSPVWGGTLAITNTTQVRARCYQEGLLPGPPQSEVYLLLQTNAQRFTSTLPVLIMDTLGDNREATPRHSFVHISVYEPEHEVTSLVNPPTLRTRAGYHDRGSSSRGMAQASFAVQLLDEFNEEHHRSVLGLPADSDWVLYAPNCYDPVMIHNPFVHELSREMGRYSPRTRFVEVFLVRKAGVVSAADYQGLYVLEEKIKVGKRRVDIDRAGAWDLKPPEVTGGYLLKIDRTGPGEAGFGAGGAGMVYVEPKEAVINLPQRNAQKQYLNTFFNDFDRALHSRQWRDPKVGYPAFIDVESWIDYHVLEVLSGNVDALGLSTYFHKPREGKIVFGPHWDFDRALGSTDDRDANPRRWNCGPYFGVPWWNKLFTDPDFWQRWVDRWQELRQTHFSMTNLHGLMDALADQVREAQPREQKRWGLQPRGGTYQSELNHMKNWLSNRVDYIDGQLVQPPRLSHAGGRVAPGSVLTLTGPASATVYYTLDGSDPRVPQGAISSNALVYAGPIQLRSHLQIVARARNPNQRQTDGPPLSTPWSGPVSAKYEVGLH